MTAPYRSTRYIYRVTGNSRSHIVAEGYQDRQRIAGAIRPAGEPSLLTGTALLIGVALVGLALVVAFGS